MGGLPPLLRPSHLPCNTTFSIGAGGAPRGITPGSHDEVVSALSRCLLATETLHDRKGSRITEYNLNS
jgi:hypothetical protein